ncbi:uncharacterized protein Z520_07634 [Fonsecaea multimorphosa CBS 102226]|uniref:Alcohol dehydrogenase-like C-terminal domain-containing protein n=1 Tax=Fonsecaea multimorphosa CBS 102226 TaxID=1442371 RepID=A0A0D2K1R1_9EURO|nr:uncharacterized protein Z520_07634 [Fonsecaea multimorphosa CBS 102226]KIX96914.1 hypothetical protein Z520_07634 [Fonsecaea multimorphosa CBS 102226]OAL22589.1 hypothetical protein AYO22_07147 [Fonsecaea multimorphosa]
MKRGGVIISISMVPSGEEQASAVSGIPFALRMALNWVDRYYRLGAALAGVSYSYYIMSPDGTQLQQIASWVQDGKIRPVVGRTVKFSDIEGVRQGCQEIFDGKGTGKFVVHILS